MYILYYIFIYVYDIGFVCMYVCTTYKMSETARSSSSACPVSLIHFISVSLAQLHYIRVRVSSRFLFCFLFCFVFFLFSEV